MRYLLPLLILIPTVAWGQATPVGCYSPNNDPLSCYAGVIDCSVAADASHAGVAVAELCVRALLLESNANVFNDQLQSCLVDLDKHHNDRDWETG